MGSKLKSITILFGPYLYFIGIILLFLEKVGPGIISIIIGGICAVFARIYCIYHVIKNRKEIKDIWVVHLIMLLFIGILYVPIYYWLYVMKKNIVFGILGAIAYPILIVLVVCAVMYFAATHSDDLDYRTHVTKDELVSVSLPNNYTCKTSSNSYSIECTDSNDSFLGLINLPIDVYFEEDINIEDFDYYYYKIVDYYKDKYEVRNENKRYNHASFDFTKYGESYSATMEVKILDEKISTIIVYICKDEEIHNYNSIFSSIGLAEFNNIA